VLSFWVKSNKTGSASVQLLQNDNAVKNISPSYTINIADTWEYKTISIPADVAGNINNDNGPAVPLIWWINSGSNFSSGTTRTEWTTYSATDSNPANLGVGGSTSDYFAITGVQLELGSTATDFEHRSYGEELALCERYYVNAGFGTNDGGVLSPSVDPQYSQIRAAYTKFPVTMRATPNISIQSSTSNCMDRYGRGQEQCYPVVEGLKKYGFHIIRKKDSGGSDANWVDSGTYINRAGYSADAEL